MRPRALNARPHRADCPGHRPIGAARRSSPSRALAPAVSRAEGTPRPPAANGVVGQGITGPDVRWDDYASLSRRGGARAGRAAGTSVRRPRCRRMRSVTADSSRSATSRNRSPPRGRVNTPERSARQVGPRRARPVVGRRWRAHRRLSGARVRRDDGCLPTHHERGYRTVFNTHRDAGQTVFHLHLHMLAGRALTWPPD